MATLFLHIGTHKTGSTYLQHCLKENVAGLQDQGWSYPDFIGTANHMSLPFVFQGKITKIFQGIGLGDAAAVAAEKQRWADGLTKHVKPDSKWIITSEFFSQRLQRPEQIQPLVDFLRQWFDEIIVVAHIRRQEYVLPSIYSQDAKAGKRRVWSWQFCEKRLATNDHLAMYDAWSGADGIDEVRLAPFLEANKADIRAILDQFSDMTGVEFRPNWVEPPKLKSNRSLSVEGIAFLAAINPQIPLVKEDGTTNRNLRLRLVQRVMDLTPGPTFNPADDVIEQVHDHYLRSNQALVSRLPDDPLWDRWLAQPTHNDKPQALVPELTAERTVDLMVELAEPTGIIAWGRPDKTPPTVRELAAKKIARRLRPRKQKH